MKLNINTSFGGSGLTGGGWQQGFWILNQFYPINSEEDLDRYLAAVKASVLNAAETSG
jgi:hypothetical protein